MSEKSTRQMGNLNGQAGAATRTLRGRAPACPACFRIFYSSGLIHKFFAGEGRRRGQSVLEYAILLGVVAAAFTVMATYSRRGIQGIIKGQADALASQADSQPIATTERSTGLSDMTTFTEETGSVLKDGERQDRVATTRSRTSGAEDMMTERD